MLDFLQKQWKVSMIHVGDLLICVSIGMRPPFFPVLYPLFIKGWLLILMCSLWGCFLFIHVTVNPPYSKAKTAFIQAYSGASSYGLRCPASDGRSDTARWFDENRGILHRDRWSFHRLEDENRLWLIQYTWSRVFSDPCWSCRKDRCLPAPDPGRDHHKQRLCHSYKPHR